MPITPLCQLHYANSQVPHENQTDLTNQQL